MPFIPKSIKRSAWVRVVTRQIFLAIKYISVQFRGLHCIKSKDIEKETQ